MEDTHTPLQYKRATLRKPRDVPDRARTKLTPSQTQYKGNFDKEVRFRPFFMAGNIVYVARPPRPLTSVERRMRTREPSTKEDLSVKLLPNTNSLFRVRSATDTTVLIEKEGVENRVSINRVTKMPRGLRNAVTLVASA